MTGPNKVDSDLMMTIDVDGVSCQRDCYWKVDGFASRFIPIHRRNESLVEQVGGRMYLLTETPPENFTEG